MVIWAIGVIPRLGIRAVAERMRSPKPSRPRFASCVAILAASIEMYTVLSPAPASLSSSNGSSHPLVISAGPIQCSTDIEIISARRGMEERLASEKADIPDTSLVQDLESPTELIGIDPPQLTGRNF